MHGSLHNKVLPILALILLFSCVDCLPSATAQPSLNEKRYKKFLVMQDKTKHMMLSGKYEQAIDLFDQIIRGLEPVEHINRGYARAVEYCYFHYGIALLEMKKFDDAFDWLAKYLQKYPNGMQKNVAVILMADILAIKEQWDQVIRLVDPLTRNLNLGERLLTAAHELRAEAHFQLKNYESAAASARYLYDRVPDRQIRTDAAIMFSICLVRLNKYKAVYAFLPNLQYESVRYDVSLNRALIEEGDREYNEARYDTALLLYRLVFPKALLETKMAERILEVERYRDNLSDTSLPTAVRNTSAVKRKIARGLKSLAKEQEKLINMPDYDQELAMRSANCYFELKRFREAIQSFWGVYHDYPEHKLADQALYATFTTAYVMGDIKRAIKEGYAYLRIFPKGQFYETVSLNLVQVHYQQSEFKECISLARKVLSAKPDHSSADQLKYLIGYNLFQLEQLEEAMPAFKKVVEEHPDSQAAEPSAYWHAMCGLYTGSYEESEQLFVAFNAKYTSGIYYSDALYRLGICQYGNGKFMDSAATLEGFVAKFPDQASVPEALTMLGDIYASEAKLDEALTSYQMAISNAVTQIQVNRATFQIAKMYRLEERWEETLTLFYDYLAKWKNEGNFTEAMYWIGTSLQRLDRNEEAMDTFFNAIIQYGNEPEHHGIDMILRDLVSEIESGKAGRELYAFKDKLYNEIVVAREANRTTLYLRLITFFYYLVENESDKLDMIDTISRREYIRFAGPLTLNLMGESAIRRNDPQLARLVFEHFLSEHRESELAVKALRSMAQLKISEGKLDEAESFLDDISGRFATLPDAGWAALQRADLDRRRKNYERAIQGFKQVVSVKEWRGPFWAEALYRMGQCELEQGQTREAFAYFQRVYVMYEAYSEWAARAYLESAHCLVKLNQPKDARKTCTELIDHPVMKKSEEASKARDLLKQLGGRL